MIKEKELSNAEIKLVVRLHLQLLDITELRQLKILVTTRH